MPQKNPESVSSEHTLQNLLFVFFHPNHPNPPFFFPKGGNSKDNTIKEPQLSSPTAWLGILPSKWTTPLLHVYIVSASHTWTEQKRCSTSTLSVFISTSSGNFLHASKKSNKGIVPWSISLAVYTITSQFINTIIQSHQNRPAVQRFDLPNSQSGDVDQALPPQLNGHKSTEERSARAIVANNLAPCDSEDVLCVKRNKMGCCFLFLFVFSGGGGCWQWPGNIS